jgi:hypothetical protein
MRRTATDACGAANVSLRSLLQANPELKVIPAHDRRAWQ